MISLAPSRLLNLVLVIGQSNAVGGADDGTTITTKLWDASIPFYDVSGSHPTYTSKSAGWETFAQHQSGFGPEYGFLRRLKSARPEENWGVIKFGSNGQRIIRFFDSGNDGGVWPVLETTVDEAIAEAQSLGYAINVRACIYLQGHADSSEDASSAAYGSNLNTLVSQYRAKWGSGMTFIVADHPGPFATETYAQRIRDAFASLAATDGNAGIANTDGLSSADDVHYTSPSKEILGIRMADAYFLIL